jgi:hypothetical protein
VLSGCRIRKFAVIPRAPALAIAEPLREEAIWILICSRKWMVLDVRSGFKSVREAEARAERMYPGVATKWQSTKVSKAQALRYERELWKGDECSFCLRIPPELDVLWISSKSLDARICQICVDELSREHNS